MTMSTESKLKQMQEAQVQVVRLKAERKNIPSWLQKLVDGDM